MDLLGRVREDFGIPLIGVRPTGLGADARASLFRGETADGTGYAVKSSSAPQPGLVVADFLASRGVPGVPAPVRTRGGELVSADDGLAVSVVPWVVGGRAIECGLTPAQWRGFGAVLGAVHATAPEPPLVGAGGGGGASGRTVADAPGAIPGAMPVDRHDPAAEVRRARGFGPRVHAALAAAPDDPVLAELAAAWAADAGRVLAVAALAESTAAAAVWEGVEAVICHADPHHGNLLLDPRSASTGPDDIASSDGSDRSDGSDGSDGRAGPGSPGSPGSAGVWLVDWDDAVLAPREADLIFVVGGVYSFAPITAREVGWFFEGYTLASGGVTRADLDPTRLTHYRSTRALTDFLDFADDVLDDRPDSSGGPPRTPAERASALRIALGALSPGGLVGLTLSEAASDH